MGRFTGSLVGVVASCLLAGCGSTGPAPTPIASSTPVASRVLLSATAAPSPSVPSAGPTPVPTLARPLAGKGSVVILDSDVLAVIDPAGHISRLASAGGGTFLLPAWSPDGSRIAAPLIGAGEKDVLVFDVAKASSSGSVEPTVIFRSPTIGPFYLSWLPGGREVSFLADEGGSLSLRVAPADGSAPLDGTGPGATIRTGNPFYFDWIAQDRLLAHVGTGVDAFLGEIDRGGKAVGAAIKAPGDFRSAVISGDRRFISYVRVAADRSSSVIVSDRDGSHEHGMPVFGPAAMAFDPSGDRLASIGAVAVPETDFGIPLGPLRLMEPASGAVRTLLDGDVASFWWSPDGRTIAALRVQAVGGAASPGASAGPSRTEVRLLFVDPATGEVDAQRVVRPGQLFIDQLLAYFDQYALSHRLWAPDSSSILIPVVDADGVTRIAAIPRNGDPAVMIDGAIGFWSP